MGRKRAQEKEAKDRGSKITLAQNTKKVYRVQGVEAPQSRSLAVVIRDPPARWLI